MDKCPIHGVEFKHTPAGISRAGKPYPAFDSCPVKTDQGYCREKPKVVPLQQDGGLETKLIEKQREEDLSYDAKRSFRIETQHGQEMSIRFLDYCAKWQLDPEKEFENVKTYTGKFNEALAK